MLPHFARQVVICVVMGVMVAPGLASAGNGADGPRFVPVETSTIVGRELWVTDRQSGERRLVATFDGVVTDAARLRLGGHLVLGFAPEGGAVIYRVSAGGGPIIFARLPADARPSRIEYWVRDVYLVADDEAGLSYALDARTGELAPARRARPMIAARLSDDR